MFGRLLWKLLRSNRGRLTVALIAVVSGATVISALLNVEFDVERKLTQEFRGLGPNVVISARSDSQGTTAAFNGTTPAPTLMDEAEVESAAGAVSSVAGSGVSIAAPYLYFTAQMNGISVIAAGTGVAEVIGTEPTWKRTGHSPDGPHDCAVGRNAAERFGFLPNSKFDLVYRGQSIPMNVAFVLDSGGPEDNQIFVDLGVAQVLTGSKGEIQLEQIRVDGTTDQVWNVIARLKRLLPSYDVRPIRAVTEAEGNLLARTRLLIVSMIVLILVLTAFCVLATMAALAMERRKDVGLMKALGGSISRILGLFLAELGTLGAAGGLIGCVLGIVLARWIGERVFGASIQPHWDIFPLTVAMMVVVALAGALPLRLLGKVKPAVILRGE